MELKPDDLPTLGDLARLLAAADDSTLRNGTGAVAIAEHACRITRHANPEFLDILAAAQAQTGAFSEAVATARQALSRAELTGQDALAREITARLRFYLQSRPLPARQ